MDNTTKTCSKCKQTKELEQFHKNSQGRLGRHNMCKQCIKVYNDKGAAVQRIKTNAFLDAMDIDRSKPDKAIIWASTDNDTKEKFISKVSIADSGCFEWTGRLNQNGYGVIDVTFGNGGSRYVLTHRLAWCISKGSLPDSRGLKSDTMVINHLCHNRKCVNPDHLEVITHAENLSAEKRSK